MLIIISTIIMGEFISYMYHRFVSHKDLLINFISRKTHRLHHILWFKDREDKAFEDFYMVVFFLLLIGSSLVVVNHITKSRFTMKLWLVYITMCLFSIYKSWIHAAYHTPDHFLNRYKFFQEWKKQHEIHHLNPKVNFSLSWFFFDKLFNTFLK